MEIHKINSWSVAPLPTADTKTGSVRLARACHGTRVLLALSTVFTSATSSLLIAVEEKNRQKLFFFGNLFNYHFIFIQIGFTVFSAMTCLHTFNV
jgi:hypothetical protein